MTTRLTDPVARRGVECERPVIRCARWDERRSMARAALSQSVSSDFVLAATSVRTSRRGGTWFRLALIFACASTETAWLGGIE